MANAYCTTTDIQEGLVDSGLSTSTDTAYTNLFGYMATRASRLIDREVAKWPGYFYPTTDGETRYFDGSGEDVQEIDDCLSITSIGVAEEGGVASTSYTTWTENTDFYVAPYNYSALGLPFNELVIDWNGSQSVWYRYRKAVKITGIWGYSTTVPDDVKQAVVIQATRWFARSRQMYQDASANPEVGQIFMTKLDPDVAQILWHYKVRNQV